MVQIYHETSAISGYGLFVPLSSPGGKRGHTGRSLSLRQLIVNDNRILTISQDLTLHTIYNALWVSCNGEVEKIICSILMENVTFTF